MYEVFRHLVHLLRSKIFVNIVSILKVRRTSEEKGWILVSDTAWPGYEDIPSDIMAGYGTIFRYPK